MESSDAGMLGWQESEAPAREGASTEAEHLCSKNPHKGFEALTVEGSQL